MAQRVQVLLVDDLDGGDANETVSFALDGVTYEIDLSESNAAKFRDDLASWIGHARRSGGRRATGAPAAPRPAAPAPGPTSGRSASGPGPTATRSATVAASRPRSRRPTTRPTAELGPVGGTRTRVAALAAAPVRVTHERVRGRSSASWPTRSAGASAGWSCRCRGTARPFPGPARRWCRTRSEGPTPRLPGGRPCTGARHRPTASSRRDTSRRLSCCCGTSTCWPSPRRTRAPSARGSWTSHRRR